MGKLTSNTTTWSWPGIGGKDSYTGTIVIHGGDITATGGRQAAGIGGREDKPSGTITIYNGKVTAQGGASGAGIGGGEGGSGEDITIYNGTVTATGGDYGAGIGGGANTTAGAMVATSPSSEDPSMPQAALARQVSVAVFLAIVAPSPSMEASSPPQEAIKLLNLLMVVPA